MEHARRIEVFRTTGLSGWDCSIGSRRATKKRSKNSKRFNPPDGRECSGSSFASSEAGRDKERRFSQNLNHGRSHFDPRANHRRFGWMDFLDEIDKNTDAASVIRRAFVAEARIAAASVEHQTLEGK
jgi:hypothetical protein